MTEQSFSNVGSSKALALIRRGITSHGFAKYPHLYMLRGDRGMCAAGMRGRRGGSDRLTCTVG